MRDLILTPVAMPFPSQDKVSMALTPYRQFDTPFLFLGYDQSNPFLRFYHLELALVLNWHV